MTEVHCHQNNTLYVGFMNILTSYTETVRIVGMQGKTSTQLSLKSTLCHSQNLCNVENVCQYVVYKAGDLHIDIWVIHSVKAILPVNLVSMKSP